MSMSKLKLDPNWCVVYSYISIDMAVRCSSLSLSNGEVSYSGSALNGEYPVNVVASFTCNYGYTLSGSASSTCENSGTWNKQDQMCNQGKVDGTWFLNSPQKKVLSVTKINFFQNFYLHSNTPIWYCQYYARTN